MIVEVAREAPPLVLSGPIEFGQDGVPLGFGALACLRILLKMGQQSAALGQERLHLDFTPPPLLHHAPGIVQAIGEEAKPALQAGRREMQEDERLFIIRAQDDARAPARMTAKALGSVADEQRAGNGIFGPRAQVEVAAHALALRWLNRQGKADREIRHPVERGRVGVLNESEPAHEDQGVRNEGEQRGEIGLRPRLSGDIAARRRMN
ncbi:hypothetical protein [Methylorubrum aminovorans]